MEESGVGIDEMHVAEPRAAGIDVHKMQLTVSLRLFQPGRAQALRMTQTFATHPRGLREMVGWLGEHAVGGAAMEGTGVYWEQPYRALEAAGIRARLVHAQHVKQIKGKKTDVADSLWLARICQFGLARASYVPPKAIADLRQMCRYRRKVVGDRARIRQRIHKLIDRDGLRLGGVLTDIFGRNGRSILDGLAPGRAAEEILAGLTWHVRRKLEPLALALEARLDRDAAWRLGELLADHDALVRRVEQLDRRVEAGFAGCERQLNLMETIPGIRRASAHAILAEIGPDPAGEFGSAANLASWAGLCPGNDESAGKRRSGRTRRGNATLRTTLTECAHAAVRTRDAQFQGHHRALTARVGYKRALFATAHKMLRIIYALLRDDQPYRDPGIDYERLFVDRNAARWLRMLEKHEFLPAMAGPQPTAA